MAKKKAAKPAKKQPAKPATQTPRQKSLPGMQDRRVVALENAALKYADIRDERMGWTKKEVESKKRVKDLMHDQGRQKYAHGNIEIELVPEDEHVRVRIHDREQPQGPDEPVEAPPIKEPELEPEEDDEVPESDNPDDYDSQPGQEAEAKEQEAKDEPSEF